MAGIVRWFDLEIKRLGIDCRLGQAADADDVRALDPDIVVLATGGRSHVHHLPAWGVADGLAVSAWDVLAGRVEPARRVLVYDGVSTRGRGVADYIASRGGLVEVVTPDTKVSESVGGTTFPIFYRRLYAQQVVLTPNTWLERVSAEGDKRIALLRNEYTDEREEREVDQVVIENGIIPQRCPVRRAQVPIRQPGPDRHPCPVRRRAAAGPGRADRRRTLPAVPRRRLRIDAQHPRRHLRLAAPVQGLLTMAAFPSLITGLFWLAVLGIGAGTLRRASLWRAGRNAPIRWLDMLAVPKRYFVDLHHVVARDPYIARAHIATAGAAVAAMLLVALNYGLALYRQSWTWPSRSPRWSC